VIANLELEPQEKQQEFLEIPDDVKEGFYGGTLGAGKSWTILYYPILRGWTEHPHFHGILLRQSYPQLEGYHLMEAERTFPKLGARYDSREHAFTFPNGGVYRFGFAARLQDCYKYDSHEYTYVGFDELTQFEIAVYLYMFQRNRSLKGGAWNPQTGEWMDSLPAVMRSGSMPLNIGHGWVKSRFMKPAPGGRKIIKVTHVKKDGTEETVKRLFIPASIYDNKYAKNDPQYIASLNELPEAERRAKLEGDWDALAGQVFTEFRETHLDGEPDHAFHVVEPFQVPMWWPKVVAIDWGFKNMMWAGLGAISPEGRVYICREWVFYQTYISVWANKIAEELPQWGSVEVVAIDPSAKQDRGQEETILQQVTRIFNREVEVADNDRIGGKNLIHEYLRWEPKPPKPVPPEGFSMSFANELLINKGEEEYNRYVNLFVPEPPEYNLPKLRIFSTCPVVIEKLQSAVYNEETSSRKKKEDIKEFDGDDPIDGTRYLLKTIHRFLEQAGQLGAYLKKKQEIIDAYRASGDYQTMDRAMRRVDQGFHRSFEPFTRLRGRTGLSRSVRQRAGGWFRRSA
jgi:hypothetical protein